jgi:hypothetical protein
MDLLDEWRVPEPSSRFDSLLHARLLETKTVAAAGWWLRLPLPVVAVSLAALFLVGALALQRTKGAPTPASVVEEYDSRALPGSAVGDLQSLEEAGELFADFDLLDQLAPDEQAASSRN